MSIKVRKLPCQHTGGARFPFQMSLIAKLRTLDIGLDRRSQLCRTMYYGQRPCLDTAEDLDIYASCERALDTSG